jgi:hypothetical protein
MIPHSPAADTYILELRSRYSTEIVDLLVTEAEKLALDAGAAELMRAHVHAARIQLALES